MRLIVRVFWHVLMRIAEARADRALAVLLALGPSAGVAEERALWRRRWARARMAAEKYCRRRDAA